MWPFGHRWYRGGGPTRLTDIPMRVDPHRIASYPDELGIVPPYTRDWGQYQTFWQGNKYPGFGFEQTQYAYPFAAIRKDVPGTATFYQQQGGAITPQVGAVSIGRILDKMRAAWASTQS